MRTLQRKILAGLAAAIGVGAAAILYAASTVPSELACLVVKSMALESLPGGMLVEPGSATPERARFIELHSQATARIQGTFGAPVSRPIVVVFQEPKIFWPLKINPYGSAGSLGNGSCVFIGPKGQDVDVFAHELMHQELHERIGSWRMFTQIPVWFNEGVAMQVDFRPRYALLGEAASASKTGQVRRLVSVRQFNQGDGEQITEHYAFAKAEVARWLAGIGSHGLYGRFERIRAGESFEAVIGN